MVRKFPKMALQMYICNRFVSMVPIHRLRLAFYRQVMGYNIGRDSYIFMGAKFSVPGKLKIGRNSVINRDCSLDSRGYLTIGMNVSISNETTFITADHDPNDSEFAGRTKPVVIGDYAFVGTRAMILPGVIVGIGGVVAAGSVVTRDVAPYTIVAGAPAKPIGERCKDLHYTIDYGVWFS